MLRIDDNPASALWVAIIAAATIASTLALACAMPFEALAIFSALYFRHRDGVALILLCWAANQTVGFVLLGYPRDVSTIAWGAGLALAALAALYGAKWAIARFALQSLPVRVVLALGVSMLAFKGVTLAFALVLGGVTTTLSLYYMAQQLAIDGVFLSGLLILRWLLLRLGLPQSAVLARST